MISLLRRLSSRHKTQLRSLGRRFGLDIRISGPSARADLRLVQTLERHGIEQVLDVGANRGQFAIELLAAGYRGRIVSFEPLPDAHAELVLQAAAHARWIVADRVALSDADGATSFNVNASDATSSLLEAACTMVAAVPGVSQLKKIDVPTRTLDGFVQQLDLQNRRSFVKIDVQGGEGLVLAGAQRTLELVGGLLVEVSLTELYTNQPLAFEVIHLLRKKGFDVWDIVPGYRDPTSFKLHQFDVVFFRAKLDVQ